MRAVRPVIANTTMERAFRIASPYVTETTEVTVERCGLVLQRAASLT